VFFKTNEKSYRKREVRGEEARKLLRMTLKKMNSKGEKQITKHIQVSFLNLNEFLKATTC
jgi:hypothetical protein